MPADCQIHCQCSRMFGPRPDPKCVWPRAGLSRSEAATRPAPECPRAMTIGFAGSPRAGRDYDAKLS